MNLKLTLSVFLLMLALAACGKKDAVKPTPDPVIKPVDNTNYHQDGDVGKLYFNKDNGINIVVLVDGFVKDDLIKNGVCDTKVKTVIDYLFTVAPFKQNQLNFNTYVVYAESQARGASKGFNGAAVTAFKSYFDKDIDRLLIPGDQTKAYEYVKKALSLDKANLIIMVVNDETYGGSGGPIATASTNAQSKYVMVHEIGHTFGGLGDEYVDLPIASNYPTDFVQYLPNIDTTNDALKIKWGHYYNRNAYKSRVNAFEGSYYRDKGFYRPEPRSIMTDLGIASFNAPSREAIARRIKAIMNVPFDLETFISEDATSIQPVQTTAIPGLQLPKNDFINMRQRIMQIQQHPNQ